MILISSWARWKTTILKMLHKFLKNLIRTGVSCLSIHPKQVLLSQSIEDNTMCQAKEDSMTKVLISMSILSKALIKNVVTLENSSLRWIKDWETSKINKLRLNNAFKSRNKRKTINSRHHFLIVLCKSRINHKWFLKENPKWKRKSL